MYPCTSEIYLTSSKQHFQHATVTVARLQLCLPIWEKAHGWPPTGVCTHLSRRIALEHVSSVLDLKNSPSTPRERDYRHISGRLMHSEMVLNWNTKDPRVIFENINTQTHTDVKNELRKVTVVKERYFYTCLCTTLIAHHTATASIQTY